MALPILNSPEFEATIPSTKQKIFFRPFLVKEEKLLFMAMQGGDSKEIQNAVRRILQACIKTEDVDVDKLAVFDIEYLFMQLRGKSVGENIELRLRHRDNEECKYVQDIELNIDDIQVTFPEGHTNTIMITDDIGMKLNYPTMNTIGDASPDANDMDGIMNIIANSVECVFDKEEVYESFTKKDIVEFIESLSQTQFSKLTEFFSTLPKLTHDITWKCPTCGVEEHVHLEGLDSFFT